MASAPRAPIATAHLFAPLHQALIALLRGLNTEQWQLPTSARAWCVRDIAAHLLDGDVRRISVDRDGHSRAPSSPIRTNQELVAYLNALNADWVRAAERISPALLADLLATTGPIVSALMTSADPQARATFPVAWAGQSESPMWLGIGREYTERWHHQDQIRDAVGAPALAEPLWLTPALELSLLAVPPAYAALDRPVGTTVQLDVSGAAGGQWCITRAADGWQVARGAAPDPASTVAVGDLALVRVLLHRHDDAATRALVRITGDAALAAPLLRARAVMV